MSPSPTYSPNTPDEVTASRKASRWRRPAPLKIALSFFHAARHFAPAHGDVERRNGDGAVRGHGAGCENIAEANFLKCAVLATLGKVREANPLSDLLELLHGVELRVKHVGSLEQWVYVSCSAQAHWFGRPSQKWASERGHKICGRKKRAGLGR